MGSKGGIVKETSKNLKKVFSVREKVGKRSLKSIIYNPQPNP